MKTKLLRIIGIVMLVNLAIFLPNQANALSCGVEPFTESYNRHDLLLHGILIEKNIDRTTMFGSNMDRLGTLVFQTITVYKGEYQDQFTIKADLSWDDYYIEGVDYVLFADKNGEHYLRDLCVPEYIVFPQIIQFLDAYPLNLASGIGVHSLYDLVTGDDKIRLENLLNLYTDVNRGNTGIVMMKSMVNPKSSCDFETDLKQTEKLLVDTYVLSKIKDETTDYTVSIDTTFDTRPQTAVVTFDGDTLKAEISVLNGKEFGNCFYGYNSKLINKITGKVEVNRDNLSSICYGEHAYELIPDLCPNKISSSIPTNPDHGGGFVDPECQEGHEQVNGICKLKLAEPLASTHTTGNNSEGMILALLGSISIASIIGIIYWWKKKN